MVHTALSAADQVASDGIDVEVIDLRTVAPFDIDTILRSVRKTTRLVIAHEAHGRGGLGAEIAAQVADTAIWHLDGPIKRVTPPFTPAPYSPVLDRFGFRPTQRSLRRSVKWSPNRRPVTTPYSVVHSRAATQASSRAVSSMGTTASTTAGTRRVWNRDRS